MSIKQFIKGLLHEILIAKPAGFIGWVYYKLTNKKPDRAQKLSRIEAMEAEILAERRKRAAAR